MTFVLSDNRLVLTFKPFSH